MLSGTAARGGVARGHDRRPRSRPGPARGGEPGHPCDLRQRCGDPCPQAGRSRQVRTPDRRLGVGRGEPGRMPGGLAPGGPGQSRTGEPPGVRFGPEHPVEGGPRGGSHDQPRAGVRMGGLRAPQYLGGHGPGPIRWGKDPADRDEGPPLRPARSDRVRRDAEGEPGRGDRERDRPGSPRGRKASQRPPLPEGGAGHRPGRGGRHGARRGSARAPGDHAIVFALPEAIAAVDKLPG